MNLTSLIKRTVFFCILFITISCKKESVMPPGDRGNPCLFSGISGVLTLGGLPLKNVRIERVVDKSHSNGNNSDETYTNEDGYFEMPAIFERTLIGKIVPMEFAVHQQVFVYHQGVKHEIWDAVKRRREENSESRGNPLIVTCELNSEMKLKRVDRTPIFSKCKWDVEPDAKLDIPPPVEDE